MTFGKVYSYVGAYNSFDSVAATPQRGYGCKDFSAKKLRVICLNTSDYYNATGGYGMSYEQKQFLMNALDLSANSDASSWKIIILSHFPLDFPGGDYNTVNDVQAILNAYVSGSSVSIAVNSSYASAEHESASGTLNYNYSGKNSAKIVANIHGHIHNHCYGRMEDNDIVRICAPNTCFQLSYSSVISPRLIRRRHIPRTRQRSHFLLSILLRRRSARSFTELESTERYPTRILRRLSSLLKRR